ncbi:MAG: guanylate kinase [Bacteroidales bacterium]
MAFSGKAVIISAPSGTGKTTLVRRLLAAGLPLGFSVSATSRSMRNGETDGKDYYFLAPDEFRRKIDAGEFLEWEEVYDNQFYGTLHSEIQSLWNRKMHVIFDVDVKGGINLKKQLGEKALAVFIMPPSLEILKLRLELRGTESPESLQKRVAKAAYELSFAPDFDARVVNDDLEVATGELFRLVSGFLHE